MLGTLSLVALASLTAIEDDEWSQFRGSTGRSVAGDTPIPATFGPGDNVLWKTTVAPGHSSPCIVAGRVFLTGFEDGKNVVIAIDRASGDVLWTKAFEAPPERQYFHAHAKPALPTPISDGERVIAYFGTYGLVALDLDGELVWEKRLPDPGYGFGVGASPLFADGLVILPRDGAPEAAILVLDATDGTELYRIDRFGFGESHGTPFFWRNADRDELVVGGTNRLCSYDLATGKMLWEVNDLCGFPCTTPTADEDTLYFAAWATVNASGRSFWEGAFSRSLDLTDEEVESPGKLFARLDANGDGAVTIDEVPPSRARDAFGFLDENRSGAWEEEEILAAAEPSETPGKNLMVAIARGGEGDVSETHVRWTWSRGLPYVASPLLYRGRIWLFKAGGIVTCLDAKSGEAIVNRERLPDRAEYYVSPVGVAGHVIAGSAEGTLYVFDAGADALTIQHTASFDEPLFATPAVLDGIVYVRTESTLWAFGSTEK